MATITSGQLTLADWAKRLNPNGSIPVIAELLSQTNAILEDAVFQEGNLPTGHRVMIRTGLLNPPAHGLVAYCCYTSSKKGFDV